MILTCRIGPVSIRKELRKSKQQIGRMLSAQTEADLRRLTVLRLYWTLMYGLVCRAIDRIGADEGCDWTTLPAHVWLKHDIQDLREIIAYMLQRRCG